MPNLQKIRNFSIISHVDAGKSTLADRFLELTETVPAGKMKPQYLDRLSLEREKGITIKLQPVRMIYEGYILNLIDTPGHVDFSYEVSRSLAATEGALLLVDARNGLEAQTVANFYLAKSLGLQIIPVINKIDLPDIDLDLRKKELADFVGVDEEEVLCVSAKSGRGTREILAAIVKKIPEPAGKEEGPFRALVFDSFFDEYLGVVVYLRVIDGEIFKGEKIKFLSNKVVSEVKDLGIFTPELKSKDKLSAGEIGYLATGLKEIKLARIGETIFKEKEEREGRKIAPLSGFKPPQPMVFAGFYPGKETDFEKFKKAIEKIELNDPAISVKGEKHSSLGFGFRLGFLGPLHLEIISERLKREYEIDLIITNPTVEFRLTLQNNQVVFIRSASEFPEGKVKKVEERFVEVSLMTPKKHFGEIIRFLEEFAKNNQGRVFFQKTDYLGSSSLVEILMPLSLLVQNFYEQLKSASHGFASYSYKLQDFREVKAKKLEILVADKKREQLSGLVYEDQAYLKAKNFLHKLKEILPPALFEIKLQAIYNGRIIAGERIRPRRKDVTAPLYGGDVSRKKKLLQKQRRGKKEMLLKGEVVLPPLIFKELFKI